MKRTIKDRAKSIYARDKTKLTIAGLSMLAILGVGVFLSTTRASGFFAATEPESAAISGNATVVSDSSASNGQAVSFNAPTPPPPPPPPGGGSSSCPLPKYPNPSCTGYPAGTTFTNTINGDYEATTPNQVIDGWHVTGNIITHVSGITIKNSYVEGDIVKQDAAGNTLLIQDTTIGKPTGCDPDPAINTDTDTGNYTALRVLLRHHSDGFRTGGPNVTIRDSYAKICSVSSADHSDGVQDYPAGNHLVVDHSTIDMCLDWTTPPTNSSCNIAGVNGAIFVGDSPNSVITNNLMIGGGYTFDVYKPTGWVVTGNRILNNTWVYGAYETNGDTNAQCVPITTWSDNTIVTLNADYSIASTVRTEPCPS